MSGLWTARYPGDPYRRRAIRSVTRICECEMVVIAYLDKSLGDKPATPRAAMVADETPAQTSTGNLAGAGECSHNRRKAC